MPISKTFLLAAVLAIALFTMGAVLALFIAEPSSTVEGRAGILIGIGSSVITSLLALLKTDAVHREVNGRLTAVEHKTAQVQTELAATGKTDTATGPGVEGGKK